jgi:HEAT repeat protein
VSVTHHRPIRSSRGDFQDFTFSSKFEVKLESPDPVRVQGILQEFERTLHSSDSEVRHSALDVLATTAPIYFQGIALRLSRDKDAFAVAHAVAALGRMNTPETRAALADVITTGDATTEDEIVARIRAIEALGRSGDASYQGLIEHYLNDKNEHIQLAAMVAVSQLGKDEAVPQLQRFFFSTDPVTRKNAAYGLRFSMTSEAVEPLINAIGDKDANVRERVLTSLKELTGHSVGDSAPDGTSPEKTQESWRTWWRANKGKLALPKLEFLCHMK